MTVQELYNAIGGNYKEAEERLMSEKFISKYIVKYLDDKSFDNLISQWNGERNEELLFRAAHTLKGVCLNLALSNLSQIAEPITENFRPTGPTKADNIDELFDKLIAEQKKTVDLITEYKNSLPN